MIDALKKLIAFDLGDPEAREAAHDRAVRLAAGVLLFEVVRADGEVTEAERTVVRSSLQGTFGISAEDCAALMETSEETSRTAASLYEFTSVIDSTFDGEQKKRIVELLWLAAFADGRKDASEEHMVRKIAGLLHVPHPDFIDAKLKARDHKD